MCLVVDTKKHVALKYKVAKEDIVCYKVLIYNKIKNVYITPYRCTNVKQKEFVCDKFQIKPEVIVKEWILIGWQLDVPSRKYIIDKGIHSYLNINIAMHACFHFTSLSEIYPVVFECVIPKNTKYWLDDSGIMICSEKIILQNEISPHKKSIQENFQ